MPSKPISRQIYPWVPTIDEGQEGSLLPHFPSKLFERGEFPKVPVLAGTCLDEGMTTTYLDVLTKILTVLKAHFLLVPFQLSIGRQMSLYLHYGVISPRL